MGASKESAAPVIRSRLQERQRLAVERAVVPRKCQRHASIQAPPTTTPMETSDTHGHDKTDTNGPDGGHDDSDTHGQDNGQDGGHDGTYYDIDSEGHFDLSSVPVSVAF